MWARNQHWVCSSIAFFELTTSAWLASQWALASTCPSTSSSLPSTAIIDVHALCLAFTWVLEIWPQVFMLTHHTFTCWIIISALQPFFKHFRSEWIQTHSLPVPWWPLFHSVIGQVKNWYIFKQSQRSVAGSHDLLESMQSLRGSPGKWADQTTRSPLHSQWTRRKAETASQLRAILERKIKTLGTGGGGTWMMK